MARPAVDRTATETPGIRKVTRTYGDGREAMKYEVRLKDRAGNLINEGTYANLNAAQRALYSAQARMDEGTHVRKRAGSATFRAVADEWLMHGKVNWKVRTYATNEQIVRGRLAALHRVPIGKVHYDHVRKLLTGLTEAGLTEGRRRRIFAVLRAVLQDAVDRDLIARNPCDKVVRKKGAKHQKAKLVIPNPEDVERLVAALEMPWSLLVEFAAYTGLRAGEIAGLRVRHLDLARRSVTVEPRWSISMATSPATPQERRGREVADLDPGLCHRLAARVAPLRGTDYVFGTRDATGKPLPYRHGNFVNRKFRPACELAGLVGVRFHDLRHFHASLLFDEGLSAVEVAARLGHHDAAFTLRTYAHLFTRKEEGRLGARIAARRAAAQGATSNVIPFPTASDG